MKSQIIGCLFFALLMAAPTGVFSANPFGTEEDDKESSLVDDWLYTPHSSVGLYGSQGLSSNSMVRGSGGSGTVSLKIHSNSSYKMTARAKAVTKGNIGLAVGGAKDTGNFFQNLENGFLPKYDSITYEGKFYDYYFDTGIGTGICKTLFCPSFARAIVPDLYSGETDYYLSIGLNSELTAESFKRKPLNLVVVLDISGSMGSRFDRYAYDLKKFAENADNNKTKMELADRAIVDMMTHLHGEDRFSVVLFDNQGYLAKPLHLVSGTDMKAIGKHIMEITDRGGTNWEAGYKLGVQQFGFLEQNQKNPAQHENRIIFITDAMPNTETLDKDSLLGMIKNASVKGIYTTILGVGIDFNADLAEHVNKTRGGNYYTIQSAAEFKKRLADEFDFMVTPLVFDLQLQLHSNDFAIEGVYGSPDANLATGSVMQINTLFPSTAEDEKVQGGVVLVKLKKIGQWNNPVKLSLTYHDRAGKQFTVEDQAVFSGRESRAGFDNTGIRKAILLTEYVSLVKN